MAGIVAQSPVCVVMVMTQPSSWSAVGFLNSLNVGISEIVVRQSVCGSVSHWRSRSWFSSEFPIQMTATRRSELQTHEYWRESTEDHMHSLCGSGDGIQLSRFSGFPIHMTLTESARGIVIHSVGIFAEDVNSPVRVVNTTQPLKIYRT